MNPGGEPERDDTGLPPVDIEIPDDARELDRDVQAYYRELRAERRRKRRRQLRRRFGNDGMVLPLLACCLVLALITGTLLTIFTATSDQNLPNVPDNSTAPTTSRAHGGHPGSVSPSSGIRSPGATTPASGASSSASSSSAASSAVSPSSASGAAALTGPSVVTTAASLPAGTLTLAGNAAIPLQALSGAMLVLIPTSCRCAAAVQWLAGIGAQEHAPTFLVGTPGSLREAERLYARLGTAVQGNVSVALDAQGVLQTVSPVIGLTILIVGSDKLVSYADRVSQGGPTGQLLQALAS